MVEDGRENGHGADDDPGDDGAGIDPSDREAGSSQRIESPASHPQPERNGSELDAGQFWLLVVGSVVFAALLLAAIGGIAVLSEFGTSGSTQDGPPEVSFTVETESTANGVAANITHRDGEALNPAELVIEVDGERRGNWTALGGQGFGVVAPGHTLVYQDVERGQEVRILWVPEGEEARAVQIGRGTIDEPREAG